MSTLRSGMDELRVEDLRRLPDDTLESDVIELQRAADVIFAERARRLVEVERRKLYRRDGFLSAEAWLADRARVSFGAAKDQVRTALALERMPATRDALAEGEVSSSAVRVLAGARESNPEEFDSAESMLLGAARESSVKELVARVGQWRRAADNASGELERRLYERRRLDLAPTPEGTVRANGEFDPEGGQTVMTALRALIDADVRGKGDMRTAEQRRADALVEICRRWLGSVDRPLVAGERPHVMVTLDLDALESRRGVSELDDVGPIAAETARRIACDASVSRVITRGRSEPLEVGRKTPVVSAALRRAVAVRDGGCRFPTCDRPQSWCDAHHIVHWADGGETSLTNLILLCRPHHRLVHGGGLSMEIGEGGPEFVRSDGAPVEDRAPP